MPICRAFTKIKQASLTCLSVAVTLSLFAGAKSAGATDSEDWGITDRCITETRISKVTFRDDRTAMVSLTDSRKLIMTLKQTCPGIQQNGYVHRTENNRLCCGDVLRVLESGRACVIDSLEPHREQASGVSALAQ